MSKECQLIPKKYYWDQLTPVPYYGFLQFKNDSLWIKDLIDDGRLWVDISDCKVRIGGQWMTFEPDDYILYCQDDHDILVVPEHEFKTRYRIIDKDMEEED